MDGFLTQIGKDLEGRAGATIVCLTQTGRTLRDLGCAMMSIARGQLSVVSYQWLRDYFVFSPQMAVGIL